MNFEAKPKQVEGATFWYVDVGSGAYGRPCHRLWVSESLLRVSARGKRELVFPVRGRIIRTEKNNLVMRPADGYITYNVYCPCGYRGSSKVRLINPPSDAFVLEYTVYSSPAGNLGVSHGCLVSMRVGILKYEWSRSGRLYGAQPAGVTILYPDGREEDVPVKDVESIQDLKDALR